MANMAIDGSTKQAYIDYAESVIVSKTYEYEGNPVSFSNNGAIMVSATQMAKPFGKRVAKWLELNATQDFLQELCEVRDTDITQLIVSVKGNFSDGREQGTWMHEDVAMEFARWLSPKFAIWCNDKIKELLARGHTDLYPIPNNPQVQFVQTQIYLAEAISRNLRLNEASRLGMYQSIAEPYRLAIPQYVESKGVTKSLKDLLADMHSPYSAIKFNQMLEAQGYIETKTRPSSGGSVKRFKSITDKGLAYGENLQSPRNQKETQPHWYADKFNELYNVVTA